MKHKSLFKMLKVIGKLVSSSPQDLIVDGFLVSMEERPINNYRAKYAVKLNGRKWLAPLYRPVLSTFNIKVNTFIAVRSNSKTCDIEYIDGVESVTFTMKTQEWREKSPYFLLIPPERLRGPLADTVRQIYELRRSQNGKSG